VFKRIPSRTLEQLLHIFDWTAENRATSPLYNWALNQVGMLDHKSDNLVVRKLSPGKAQLAIHRFARSQQVSRRDSHLANQFGEFFLTQRLRVVIHFFKRYAALTEESIHLAALGARWLFVNRDFHASSARTAQAVFGFEGSFNTSSRLATAVAIANAKLAGNP
jgi:hypothetical protein